jgi:EAL domain-containing protein (putative c-di-GMP-specific phosphodiesterase class I)
VQTFVATGDDESSLDESERAITAVAAVAEPDRFRSYHEQLNEVVSILRRDRVITCLYVDLSALRRIELELGVAQHAETYDKAGSVLDEMRGEQLRHDDLICRTDYDDAYLCFLSSSRGREEAQKYDLENIASRVQDALNTALAADVRDLIRDKPRIVVGHARVLNNSMLRPERLVTRLITEAQGSALLARERSAQRNKTLLQEIILGEGLTPVYQPIVHIQSGDIFGYEALTRGPRQSPMESPATLFAVAEEVDLVFELDRACFRGALRGAVGLEPVHRLFVNLLPLSFYDTSFIEQEVSVLLEAAALTPANIVFEITERLAIENFTTFRRALATYTAMGFGVAIDDVGTRHSNLETVMALRPHFIKISDVLIRGVARSAVKREMLRSLRNIAETIDAVIVAEGIETADDLVVLHDLGVTYAQGFFLARPGAPFPRLRASVKRAVRTIADQPRTPIPSPPAEFDFDNDGEQREDTNPAVRHAAAMAVGSGQFLVDDSKLADNLDETQEVTKFTEYDDDTRPAIPLSPHRKRPDTARFEPQQDVYDDFQEKTRPRTARETSDTGDLLEELGLSDSESGAPLLDSLRETSVKTDDHDEPPSGDNGVH